MRCIFAGKSKVINIIDNTILKDIKARLRSGNGQVTLEFTDKKDESREGNKINGENDSKNKDN